ncbi:DNA-binding domain-containing protein [Carboxylicivirga sp. M1479]|uniref:DNA-binding domain-containing protein n=1 Tax=Carboxylicivirga sp. M1479 TaxID=2594476 RepID=UPI001177D544|nr:DNA-binding domain-containing protein [Carboxylicivirga sp. M1479]TRX72505.1 DUF4469 domain-containing protein [Carboxylicivirga sp. M1479]
MAIEFALFKNHLTQTEDDCFAIVQNRQVIYREGLINRMTGRGLALLDTEVDRVLKEEAYAIKDLLLQGMTVETPLVTITPVVKGAFENEDDVFDPERHSIEFNVKLGDNLKIDTSLIDVTKVKPSQKSPLILNVEDRFSDTANMQLTPNGTLVVQGIDLKVITENDDEGLYFKINSNEVKADKYFNNTDSKLEVKVPLSLEAGSTCQLEVRKRYKGNKKLYIFKYNVDFTVAGS